jgi:hypothetical protein
MVDLYPPYIFGMHDRGGEHLMLEKNRPGWVLVTEGIGADPNNHSGGNYTDLANRGLGVIVRLNNGYGTAGTIPFSSQYDDFARRCGNFVEASPGCHRWIIGNEMNLAWERPGGPDGQEITPQLYAACFIKCRNEIRRRPGHADDQVIPGAVGPWNTQTTYPGNPGGDWIRYFSDMLSLIGGAVDAMAIHTYTHGQDANLVFSGSKMNPPFQNYHWHFRAYRDFMAAIPDVLRNRPVYITETDQYEAWLDAATGWVRNAYWEINEWNGVSDNQPIQALILFRWIIGNANDPQQVGWAIENKPGVQEDFRSAMNNAYEVILPGTEPEYLAAWLQVNAPTVFQPSVSTSFSVTVRNDGRGTWASSGTEAVRLGHRWIDDGGNASEGIRTSLPHAVAAGQTVTLPNVTVRAPNTPGFYTLELDMVEGAAGWFAKEGSPTWRADNVRVGARYRTGWLDVDAPTQGNAGQTTTFPIRFRNDGSLTWIPTGENPFNLTYKWLDENRNVVVADGLRTPLGREVAPLEEIALDAALQFPPEPGQYTLMLDMVHEFVTWFHWKGSPVYEVAVDVAEAAADYAAEWLSVEVPDRLITGQPGSAYIEVKNIGALAWPKTGDGAVQLGYRWLDMQGQDVPVTGAEPTSMPRIIQPGVVATFRDVAFVAPGQPDTYRLVWDLIQDGVWLSSQGVAVAERVVQIVAAEYGVEWTVLEPWPDRLPPGEVQQTSLRLRNTGTRTWTAGGDYPVHLAYTWFTEAGTLSEPWDTFRILLSHDVLSGDVVDLPGVAFQTPTVLGDYTLRWDLVEEGMTWFFRQGAAPLEVPLRVAERTISGEWQADASHNSDDVALAFDGDANTFWDSQATQEPGMWFLVDLGDTLVLDRIKVASPGRGFPLGYRILLSVDGQDWQVVAERAQNWTDVDEAFAPHSARYLRVEQTGQPAWPASWMISEIAVSATSLWSTASASHYAGAAARAVDASLETAWNTRSVRQRPNMWFEVDMGSPRQIERVALEQPGTQWPRGYVVRISSDGHDWQEVARKDDNWQEVDVQFEPARARYVRVETTSHADHQPWGITGVVVWRSDPRWMRGKHD